MSLTFPASAADITTEWLNEALAPVMGGGKVLASEALASATPGQTAEIV